MQREATALRDVAVTGHPIRADASHNDVGVPVSFQFLPCCSDHRGCARSGFGIHRVSDRGAAASLPQPITDVTSFGALGDGTSDSGPAVHAALLAAESTGGTLYFPAGHYLMSSAQAGAVSVTTGGLTIAGADQATTVLTMLSSAPVVAIHADNTTVQDLTLDTQTGDFGSTV